MRIRDFNAQVSRNNGAVLHTTMKLPDGRTIIGELHLYDRRRQAEMADMLERCAAELRAASAAAGRMELCNAG